MLWGVYGLAQLLQVTYALCGDLNQVFEVLKTGKLTFYKPPTRFALPKRKTVLAPYTFYGAQNGLSALPIRLALLKTDSPYALRCCK